MPVIVRPAGPCVDTFNPVSRPSRGIPLAYFVRPVVRHGGMGADMPKGFELPGCMVDPCCVESTLVYASFVTEVRGECSDMEVTFTLTITNTGAEALTNLTMTPIPLDDEITTIASGDTQIVLPPTATLAPGASIVLTATTTYVMPEIGSPVSPVFTAGPASLVSDQATNVDPISVTFDLCGILP